MFKRERYECPVALATPAKVYIDDSLLSDINDAVSAFQYEFLLVLIGERRNNNTFIIRNVIVPPQRVSAGSVEADLSSVILSVDNVSDIVGYLHSHNTMSAFHSLTDEENVDNAPLSLVFATRGWCGKAAVRLPCGRWGVTRNIVIASLSEYSYSEDVEKVDPSSLGEYREPIDCAFDVPPCGLRLRRNRLLAEIKRKATLITFDRDRDRLGGRYAGDKFPNYQ